MAKNAPKEETTVETLRRRLGEEKGNWPRIAKESGVPYGTLEKVGQGDTTNPQYDTVEKLLAWFRASDAMRAALRGAQEKAA